MQLEKDYEIIQAVPVCGGGHCESTWIQDDNKSTYYSYTIDKQGSIPGRSIEELKKELGID